MKSIKKEKLVTTFPCIMKDQFDRIVLVSELAAKQGRYQVTVIGDATDKIPDLGLSWESELKPTEYFPLPQGFEISLVN